ncbi:MULTISPECIES: hypothetical protein [Sphingomonadaceae]|uniref:hypothetical protein n=1 Tax=Sphingomonadales TaxID=204457 RepID=UPI000770404C|nr:hypothetical protein [Sphingobium sp. TKS]AMK23282.1 hypothetical protein K426_11735 [Sphingobium sp. TKS]MCF8709135.1 hypothetical protein [Rhizorhapis sp. SPR117]
MDDFEDNFSTIFSAPICPTCATSFDSDQYDDVDDCARCSNCGTTYKIPDDCRPLHPEDNAEHAFLETAQSVALDQFRADAKRVSEAMMRQTAGGTYEMYERWFTEALEPYLDDLDPALRHHAIAIARDLGYIDDPDVIAAGFGPGLCSISGIEEHYCHCGRHE